MLEPEDSDGGGASTVRVSRIPGRTGFRRGLLVALGVLLFNLAILFAMSLVPGETWDSWRADDGLEGTLAALAFAFFVTEIVGVLVLNRPRRGPDGASQFLVVLALLPFYSLIPLFFILFPFFGSST